jgi:formyl-CoA transferase
VVECAHFIAGPYAAQLLGDLGAEVIKVEKRGVGDPSRAWGQGQYSPWFIAHNRNKRSITLDLRKPEAKDVVARLLQTVDVVIENYRPGIADRLGMGWAYAHELNPRLIYCSISGFGRSCALASRPSFDSVAQGMSGLMGLLVDSDAPRPVGPPLSDTVTGIFAAQAVLAALVARAHTGQGQHIETSMLEATLSLLAEPLAVYLQTGLVMDAYSRARVAQIYAFRCADRQSLVVHLSSPDKFWISLLTIVGRLDLLDDPELSDRSKRLRHYDRIHEELSLVFLSQVRDVWLQKLTNMDVPCAPVYTIDQVMHDAQIKVLRVIDEMEHPVEGHVRTLRSPLHFSMTPLPPSYPPPTLGEDTHDVLTSLGFSEEYVVKLRDSEVI